MKKDYLFEMIRNKCLVIDIETSSFDAMGREINIFANFEGYVENALVKWFGAYSYLHDEVYLLNAMDKNNREIIKELLAEHDTIIGFNSEEFDYPILVNNNYADPKKRVLHVDCMQILGKATFKNRSGYGYKDRGELMGFKYAKNSLKCMAETMLETQKGDIDYKIFHENFWDEETTAEIKKYLNGDVVATSELFDKLWDFWLPFTDLLDPKYVKDLSWIRSSISSLTYKAACTLIGVEPTYGEKGSKKEEMGGRVIMPKYEEARNGWLVDFASLYPHIMCMFNLFSENTTSVKEHGWHGNDLFKVRGYYFTEEKHELNLQIENMLKTRIDLKKNDPTNPMIYATKIFLNCFSADTEIVMGDNSIKKIKDCMAGEIVHSINPVSLKSEKKKILKVYEYDYNGEMHHYKGDYFDFNVTPNHKFLLQHKKNINDVTFIESRNIQSQHKIPTHKKMKNKYKRNINILNYLNKSRHCHKIPILYNNKALSYIIGIYLSEGSLSYYPSKKYKSGNIRGNGYVVNLAQDKVVNPDIYKKITDALDTCGLKYSAGKQAIRISGKIFHDFVFNNFGKLGNKHFKNKELLEILNLEKVFEALIDGDGTKRAFRYTTKYDCLKNDFIELCIRLGYTFHIYNDGCWRIVYNKNANSFRKANRTVKKYKGNVYCIEVEDNNTLLAGSNGKFNWSGNSLYGVARSAIFEKLHTPNCGWDCCWIGQQIHELTETMMEEFGFETIYGDTDSLIVLAKDEKYNNKEYVQECLAKILKRINDNAPFPVETFGIDIEDYLEYIMFPFSEQETVDEKTRKILNTLDKMTNDGDFGAIESGGSYSKSTIPNGKNKTKTLIIDNASGDIVKTGRSWEKTIRGKKKNYLYIANGEVVLKGLPIKKANATHLGIKIYNDVLLPLIKEKKSAKFERSFIESHIDRCLQEPGIMQLISQEYKVKCFCDYKRKNQIQAQISAAYFNKADGVINLIKNRRIGKAGQGDKYCTVEEALEAGLTIKDISLDKIWKELTPFIKTKENL